MPRASKLKVYRTPIGFHDAYVAAASQKAALEAWGSDANLFARGMAEQVEDPDLTAEPLTRPGEVIKRLRGTLDEQLAAFPPDQPSAVGGKGKATGKAAPPPSRAELDAAEAALNEVRSRHAAEDEALTRRARELASERQQLTRQQKREVDEVGERLQRARKRYEAALAARSS